MFRPVPRDNLAAGVSVDESPGQVERHAAKLGWRAELAECEERLK